MKVTKPYEVLIRCGLDGAVVGAHIKAQSYYLDDAGNPDLSTWREIPPTPAAIADPAVAEIMQACGAATMAQLTAAQIAMGQLQAQLEEAAAEIDRLRAQLPHEAAVEGEEA